MSNDLDIITLKITDVTTKKSVSIDKNNMEIASMFVSLCGGGYNQNQTETAMRYQRELIETKSTQIDDLKFQVLCVQEVL